MKSTDSVAPKAAPVQVHEATDPGSRRPASSPASAPTMRPENAADRARCDAGRSSADRRSTGDSNTWRTSASSIAKGPPRLPLRMPAANAMTANMPNTAGPLRKISATVVSATFESLTKPESHRALPPNAKATRYTR